MYTMIVLKLPIIGGITPIGIICVCAMFIVVYAQFERWRIK